MTLTDIIFILNCFELEESASRHRILTWCWDWTKKKAFRPGVLEAPLVTSEQQSCIMGINRNLPLSSHASLSQTPIGFSVWRAAETSETSAGPMTSSASILYCSPRAGQRNWAGLNRTYWALLGMARDVTSNAHVCRLYRTHDLISRNKLINITVEICGSL